MRIRAVALAAAVGLAAAGCGSTDTCPKESPQVNTVGDCSAVAGQPVSFPLRLCPTCNQTISSCDVDLSAVGSGQIFLNPTVEVCSSAGSCGGAACSANPATCTFTAPSGGPYDVLVFDPGSNTTKQGTLTIVPGSPSCSLPPA